MKSAQNPKISWRFQRTVSVFHGLFFHQIVLVAALAAVAQAGVLTPAYGYAAAPIVAHAPVAYAHAPVAYAAPIAHAPVAYAAPIAKVYAAAPVAKIAAPAASEEFDAHPQYR